VHNNLEAWVYNFKKQLIFRAFVMSVYLYQPFMNYTNTLPKLLDKVCDRIRIERHGFCAETQYVQWIKRFMLFHGKRYLQNIGPA